MSRLSRLASPARVTRERAARLCSMMACRTADDPEDRSWFVPPCRALGVSIQGDAAELARLALWATESSHQDANYAAWWADAEALIRTGWSPNFDRYGGAL